MILLGVSFILWAVLIYVVEFARFSYDLTYNLLNLLGLGSLALTGSGLAMCNIGLGKMIRRGRALTRYSTFFFVWINIIGLYLAYNSYTGGYTFSGMSLGDFMILTSVFFSIYVALFSLFVAPFLNRIGITLLSASAVLMEVFMVLSLRYLQYMYTHPSPTSFPGDNMPYSVTVANPAFGFPLFQLNPYLPPSEMWLYLLPIAASLVLSLLYFVSVAHRERLPGKIVPKAADLT